MQIDLGTTARFRVTAQNELRGLQVGTGASSLDELIKNLAAEAANEGIDIGLSPKTYNIDGPFDADGRTIVAEVQAAYEEWIAAGKPVPAQLTGFGRG